MALSKRRKTTTSGPATDLDFAVVAARIKPSEMIDESLDNFTIECKIALNKVVECYLSMDSWILMASNAEPHEAVMMLLKLVGEMLVKSLKKSETLLAEALSP